MRRSPLWLGLILTFVGCSSAPDPFDTGDPRCVGKCDSDSPDAEPSYEYIVVGAGAGGGTLASSLARMNHSVLLVEAGSFERNARDVNAIPAFHPRASEDPETSWQFFVDHYGDPARQLRDSKETFDAAGEPQGIFYPRGATVGGSTAVNAMIAVYPHESDWDTIADITGDQTWRPWRMREHFARFENNDYLGLFANEDGHGFDGWHHIGFADARLGLADLKLLDLVKAAAFTAGDGLFADLGQILGLMNRDVNAYTVERDSTEGIFSIPMSVNEGKRNGVRERIIDTVAQGYPLTLWTQSLATRVLFDEDSVAAGRPRAIGVDLLQGAHLYRADRLRDSADAPVERQVFATREVIVAGGAFNTPQILQLSGIGPTRRSISASGVAFARRSARRGPEPAGPLRGGPWSTKSRRDFSILGDCAFTGDEDDPCYQQWLDGAGPYRYERRRRCTIIKRSSRDLARSGPVHVRGAGQVRRLQARLLGRGHRGPALFTWLILKAPHPQSRRLRQGALRRTPATPREINFRYFDDARCSRPGPGRARPRRDGRGPWRSCATSSRRPAS